MWFLWGSGDSCRGVPITLDFSPELLGPSLECQGCRGGAEESQPPGLRCWWDPCRLLGPLCHQPLLSHVQDAPLALAGRWPRALGRWMSCSSTSLFPSSPSACSALVHLVSISPVHGGAAVMKPVRLWGCFCPGEDGCRPRQRGPWLWSHTVRFSLVSPGNVGLLAVFTCKDR